MSCGDFNCVVGVAYGESGSIGKDRDATGVVDCERCIAVREIEFYFGVGILRVRFGFGGDASRA